MADLIEHMYAPLFDDYACPEDYINQGLKPISPMLAKEIETDEEKSARLNDPDYFVEEKFDGTRATLHFQKDHCRCFSRRVSEKTGWFFENSDSVPHIRHIAVPELDGTIIDGEMFIPNRPFKDVSSTLNCKWDKAIARQDELGKIVFHAFDILYYKGIKVENMPLYRRKVYLHRVIDKVNSPYVEYVVCQNCGNDVSTLSYESSHGNPAEVFQKLGSKCQYSYPAFYEYMINSWSSIYHNLSPRAFYEYIVATGGEGVIVKPKDGKYHEDKRGWEYSKIKKFLTREVIILGFNPPTKEYKGKFINNYWAYWYDEKFDEKIYVPEDEKARIPMLKKCGAIPVTKYFFEGWIGTIRFGVAVTSKDIEKLSKKKKLNIDVYDFNQNGLSVDILEVGECSGFDEDTRRYLTDNRYEMPGQVIEIKANEIFNDTGKLRHPRFLRFRPDKNYTQCTFSDHISQDIVK